MRDPSHTHALTIEQLLSIFDNTEKKPELRDFKVVEVDFQKWVQLTKTPQDVVNDIMESLESEIRGGDSTGLEPHFVDGNLKFYQRWVIVEATI